MKGERFKVVAWHGEGNSIFRVIDTKTGRVKGETSLRRDGGSARELADIQARALNKSRAGARKNPRGRKLKVELRQEGGYWSVYVNGVRTVDRESFSVADRIKGELERPSTRHTEAGEVAESIRKHFAGNPSRMIRSTRRRAKVGEQRWRGKERFSMLGGTLGDANFHVVQVQRAGRWLSLVGTPRGEMGHQRAVEYGKMLARRYPRQKFRVFWPDTLRKNPSKHEYRAGYLVRMITVYAHHNGYGDLSGEQVRAISGSPARVIKETETGRGKNRITRLLVEVEYAGRIWYGWIDPDNLTTERQNPRPRKNPAPRADRVNGAEVDAAAKLYQAFTGHRVTRARQVTLPRPKVGLAIGPVLGISYATTRDGKRENYQHDFRRGARPLLAVSQDGRTLMLLGGAHRFTPRGIVDQR